MTTKVNQTCWKCSRTCSHGRVGPCLLPVRWLPLSLLMLFSITLTSGCATYVHDRMADAGDIITVTVGEGLGVTAKAGPIHTGLGYCFDYYGLRCGEILKRNRGAWDFGEYKSGDFALVILAVSGFWSNECNNLPKRAEVRGKTFESEWLNWQGNGHFVPFFDVPSGHHGKGCPSQLTQMDMAIGVGISIRLGINPLELVDFILGFVGLDIYDDDVAGAKGEEKERQ